MWDWALKQVWEGPFRGPAISVSRLGAGSIINLINFLAEHTLTELLVNYSYCLCKS